MATNSAQNFRQALDHFAEELRVSFSSAIPAQPEDQLKAPVQALLRTLKEHVVTRTEAQLFEIGARPDIGVSVRGALTGFVELKAPGIGARVGRLRGRDKQQWEKFAALPNIFYTDGVEWALYRSGASAETSPRVIRFDELIERGSAAIDGVKAEELHLLLLDFLTWEPIAPGEPKQLAEVLAPLCRLLRSEVLVAVVRPESALHRLSVEIREYLFPHSTDTEFADVYAQTLTYALLLARLNGETDLTAVHAADALDSGHGLLAQTLRILTQPAARAEIEMPVALLERVISAVDPQRLSRRGDPWLYFYEYFLAAYDPKLRKSYGVYYTPQQVIRCQVNLVSELLEREFNKPLAFADEGVVLLDSSAGTAAYPIAAIESSLRRVEEMYGAGMVAASATRCAQNVYGFELLVGPYAVAHLRLTKMFSDAGAALPADGIHMYLTDTLESPHIDPPMPPLFADRLTTEQRRARRVKSEKPIFVCMGNPPYFREEGEEGERHTRGKWVRFGDDGEIDARPILKDFTEPAGGHAKNLYNLYVYFWRWTLWKMFENPHSTGTGIVSYITASSYLRGPGFVGMRQSLREAFDDFWIIDLEGDNLGARKTENVFDIQTPVCIAFGVRYAPVKRNVLAAVHYAKLVGTREQKFVQLMNISSFADIQWRDCFTQAQEPLWPLPPASWSESPALSNLWPWQHSGVQWKRAWPISENREVLRDRWRTFLSLPRTERGGAMHETAAKTVNSTALDFTNQDQVRLPAISSLDVDAAPMTLHRYAYRSLDRRWILADGRLCDRPRPPLWQVSSETQIYMTSLMTGVLGEGPSAIASCYVPDLHHFRGSFGGKDVIPLWRDAAGTQPNLPGGLLETLSAELGPVSAEDFFAYTYAILSAPTYAIQFWDELTNPGPRIPVTRDVELFRNAVACGRRLLHLHTYGERFAPRDQLSRVPPGATRCTSGIPNTREGYPSSVAWDAECLRIGTGELSPVSAEVWNYSVSGFLVVQMWIKSRLQDGAGRQSSALDQIRAQTWTAESTQELLELLWVVQATLSLQPELNALLEAITSGALFRAADLPSPSSLEHAAPGRDEDVADQQDLHFD